MVRPKPEKVQAQAKRRAEERHLSERVGKSRAYQGFDY